jgi:lipopolysaccharide/colanic/teichoic acid biosynthesis glycosyltransferase
MQHFYHSPAVSSEAKRLIFVGFDQNPDRYILNFQPEDQGFQVSFEQNFELAKHHVLAKEESCVLLVEARWCLDDRFRLLQFVAQHDALAHIPVVVLTDRTTFIEHLDAIRKGADDSYDAPIQWDVLQKRLSFLLANKPAIVAYATQTRAEEQFWTPPVSRIKRAIDVIVASAALVAVSPLLVLTAAAIAIESKGPILYCSKRAGYGCREFNFWKFRSMYADADERLKDLLAQNQYGSDAKFVKFQNDPRITRVGRFIRKYSIDELPQLFNILVGDMSLVGNRPLPVYESNQLVYEDASARFLAPAGLTGLWQVSKRGTNDMSAEERIGLDVRYAQERSLRMDARILLRTFGAFIQKENV